MGMTIDEAIRHLDTYSSTMGSGQTTQKQHEKAKRVAIETIRKYQKIEQILSDWINDDLVGMSDYWMGRIKEVIEDGND